MRVFPVDSGLVEVDEPRLLELVDRVQHGVLVEARLLGEGGEHGFALFFVAPVRHREEAVWPVVVDWSLIAMRDATVRGHDAAGLVDAIFVDDPDAHAVLSKARLAVVDDGGETAHASIGQQLAAHLHQFGDGKAVLLGEVLERLGNRGKVCLQRADSGDLSLGWRAVRSLERWAWSILLGGRIATTNHVEVDTDLVEADGGQRTDRLDVSHAAEQFDRLVEPNLRVAGHGDREPQVEIVLALVVVRHAWVGADDVGCKLLRAWLGAGRDEARLVAESARVEDPRDLPHDTFAAQSRDALEHLVLWHFDLCRESAPRAFYEGQLIL